MSFTIKQPPEERLNLNVQFAILLRDGFADSDELLGKIEVKAAINSARRKAKTGLFWFHDVTPGNQALAVTSREDPPYYLAKKINVTIPAPAPPAPAARNPWPAFPD